jgi:hypothetical protein
MAKKLLTQTPDHLGFFKQSMEPYHIVPDRLLVDERRMEFERLSARVDAQDDKIQAQGDRIQTLEAANEARGRGDRTPKWFHWAKPLWEKNRPKYRSKTTENMIREENMKLATPFRLPDELARAILRQLNKGNRVPNPM